MPWWKASAMVRSRLKVRVGVVGDRKDAVVLCAEVVVGSGLGLDNA